MIDDFSERHYPFEGCFNFRDIGGYPNQKGKRIRSGLYFRAGRQDRMSEPDLDKLKTLNVATQIDLRRPDEIQDQGRGPLGDMGAKYENIAVIPEGGTDQLSRLVGDTGISGRRYLGYLQFGPESWLRMFEIFADKAQLPVVLHCTAGKDRTGVSTAFLLSVLGVSREWIEADFLLTNVDTGRQADFIEKTVGYPPGVDRKSMILAAGVPQDAMKDFLDGVEAKWGSATGYLQEIGVTQAQMDSVRENFLE